MQYNEKDSVRFFHIGKNWHIYRADMEYLWDNMENDGEAMQAFSDDERLPYWAELWPSSFGLAFWLLKHREQISGVSSLDLGCGLGYTALCGAYLGAKVLACDYEKNALELTAFNARMNDVSLCSFAEYPNMDESCVCTLHMDWRTPIIPAESFSYIWAADIAYERKFMSDILKFLDYALAGNGVFWIAEPGRAIYEHFLEEAKSFPFTVKLVHKEITPKISEHILSAQVNIWEVARK